MFVFVVVVVVVCFYQPIFLQVVYRRQGVALVSSVIPAALCDNLKSYRNSVEGDIGYIRSKRGTVQP